MQPTPRLDPDKLQHLVDDIVDEVQPLLEQGEVAAYIPELARVNPRQFGIAICTVDGAIITGGAATTPFSIQSISKVFALTLAMHLEGEPLWQRIGREPSGTPFNSLVQLEHENGIPRNPFINAGALVVTDVLLSHGASARQLLLDFVRERSGNSELSYNERVAQSEAECGHRNRALAHFLKSFGNLQHDADSVLDAYFYHCALEMSCTELARCALFLANAGLDPYDQARVTTANQTKYINSLLLTCGTYDAVGDFAYRVGLPGKSGVGGGIVAIMPGHFSICAWAPGLNRNGNSLAATAALDLLTTRTGISIF
ncbi:MAG: glutaminase [Gammaproteobacteria bacterium]|nr:glutaminase [Gammaproteobacteria bacterium]NND59379.1 glutaminase [Gammaproteobacteria bacterium]